MKKAVVPVYQPIVNVETGDVLHYEALARMRQGNDEHAPLIQMGERLQFIDALDLAMLGHVCTALSLTPNEIVAVNVSAATLEYSCDDYLSDVFKNMRWVPRLVFEITETREIRNFKMVDLFISSIRLLNGRIALDDFGTGFCTMGLVKQLQPEFVKLAGETVRYFCMTGDASTIEDVIHCVEGYGGQVIAEHIDTLEKAEQLRKLGVKLQQGYYVGNTVPLLPSRWTQKAPALAAGQFELVRRAQ